jgi:hypothetical protein
MNKKLDEIRMAARLRRRPPAKAEFSAIHLALSPSSPVNRMDRSTADSAVFSTLSRRCAPNGKPYSTADRLTAAAMFLKLKCEDDFRHDQVSHVSEAVRGGTYESALKLEIAADRLLDDLLGV